MGAIDQLVRARVSVPTIIDFQSAVGSPLVTDSSTGRLYTTITGDIVGEVPASGIVSVKDPQFGAKGDGVTDDTAAVAAWIAACAGKAGYAPAGTYLTTAEIAYNVQTSGSIKIFGDGPTTIFKASGTNNKVFHFSGTAGVTINPVSLCSFSIQSSTSGTSAAGLHLDGIAHWFIEDVWIDGKNKMTNGLQLTGSQQGQVSGGQIQNCITGGLLESSSGIMSNGVDWHGMTFINTTTNFKVTGADDVFFHANHLTSAAMQIDLTMNNGMGIVMNNHLEPLAGNNGMIVRSGNRVLVLGNSFYGIAGTTDINILSGANECKIIGNLIDANVSIAATDTTFCYNSTGGTVTDSGTRTRNFGNIAFAGTPLIGSTLYDSLTINSKQAAGASMLTVSPPAVAGDWGMQVNGAGAAQDIYLRFSTGAVIAGRTDNAGIINFKSGPAGTLWASISSTGVTIASGNDLQLGRAYSAGVVAATGTIPMKDNTGTVYNVLVHT